jgi:3',5'-nucleoside bisphosphate phosphatase
LSAPRLNGADLHLHTTYSDGAYTPEELVAVAREKRLAAIAVTDHDILDGVAPARSAAGTEGPEVISGVEFGVASEDDRPGELHIVGLFVDTESARLRGELAALRDLRRERVLEMIERLNRCGVTLRPQQVFSLAAGDSVGRLHVARALLEIGHVKNIGAAFHHWLGVGKPAYVPRERPTAVETIDLIHSAGGVAIMAHPGQTQRDDQIAALAAVGLDGLEAFSSDHTAEQVAQYIETTEKLGLLVSGGSDCHGHNKDRIRVGSVRLEESRLEALRRRAQSGKR